MGSCTRTVVASQTKMKSFVAVLAFVASVSAKAAILPAAYAAGAYAYPNVYGYTAAAPAVTYGGLYNGLYDASVAYANLYPAAEPYVHAEIEAEPYVHEEIAAEPYVDAQIAAEPYVDAQIA